MNVVETKLIAGRYKVPAKLEFNGDKIYVHFRFNRILLEEIKNFQGRKWHGYDEPPRKVWSIPNTPRNLFQLDFLQGKNPYAKYDVKISEIETERPLYAHQKIMVAHGLAVHYGIWACEMGTGKTLSAIELMERTGIKNWLWLGPRAGMQAIELELLKWKSQIWPRMLTYEGLKKELENWSGDKAPQGVIFDESSKIKSPTAQRSQSALHLANAIREEWGDKGYVILMSGSPAPKSPIDWWHQCEVAQPGFLKEGDIHKFKFSLGLYKEYTAIQGQTFQKLISWFDNEKKCLDCGEFEDHPDHNLAIMEGETHSFRKSINEVTRLYKRMKGLVLVQFKKDCLDLPDKQYRMITVKPTQSILRAASLITKTAPRAVTALILLRELSDGFQYENIPIGEQKCPRCKGTKFAKEMVEIEEDKYEEVETICPLCSGVGEIPKIKKEARQIPCPKEDKLREIIEEHDEVGRIVIYAGFTGSVDRCVNICKSMKWTIIRVDGRGWHGQDENGNLLPKNTLLRMFQEDKENYPRVAFIGQPGAAGMALTLTASPTIVYYSNTFHGEDRIQSEDRIHRPGMDLNRGATIIDLIHLPTDLKVLDNIKKKRELQRMSMGELEKALKDETNISRN